MEYIFLVVAAAWSLQFYFSYRQFQRFNRRLAELRRLGRAAVGLHGNQWRGRTYAVVVSDGTDRIRHVELFEGWTIFAKLRPIDALRGMTLQAVLAAQKPPLDLKRAQWQAIQHAATFLTQPTSPQLATT